MSQLEDEQDWNEPMIALIRLTPKQIEELGVCLSRLSPDLLVLFNVLFWSSLVLFFMSAALIEREKNQKKMLSPSLVCFGLFTLLISGSLVILGFGCT